MSLSLFRSDLELILENTRELWSELQGSRIFITGGTGFFGRWILESFSLINRELGLNARAIVLTRDIKKALQQFRHIMHDDAIQFHEGEIRTFNFPRGEFSHLIHAGTSTDISPNNSHELVDIIVGGANRSLEFARISGVRKILFTSSGAVYGDQPSNIERLDEDFYEGSSEQPRLESVTPYGEGKRKAESLFVSDSLRSGIEAKIARGFAFVGPGLPLDRHFALGNFINDAIQGRAIRIEGDGTPYRSYLYAADLTIWLWTILFAGKSARPYNVGSEDARSILDIARAVQKYSAGVEIEVTRPSTNPSQPIQRYIPSTARVRNELGLREITSLEEGISKTIRWLKGT